jgi:hypothetical protein
MNEEEIEIWKDILGYEDKYQVSSLGRVKSLNFKNTKTQRLLKLNRVTKGYLSVQLCKDGKQKYFEVHQLVAMAFLNHIRCGHRIIVDHKDNVRANNRLDNLQLLTNRENVVKEIDRTKTTSKYTGVTISKPSGKWVSKTTVNGKTKVLGYFNTEAEASEYYQNALIAINNGTEICVKVTRKPLTSEYKGVCWSKEVKKWKSEIQFKGNLKRLGFFNLERDAHLAYQKELEVLTLINSK